MGLPSVGLPPDKGRHDTAPFDARDLAALVRHRDLLPGTTADTPLLAVTRTGTSVPGLTVVGPDELVAAWPG